MPERSKRIAAIDIGTNSIHMIVAEAKGREYRVVDREKDAVQLGLSSLDGQPLTDDAIERGVASISRMSSIAARWQVDEVIAVATSAVREAPNRREFLRRIRDAAGIKVKVISGEEEADLIFRAVRGAVDLRGSTALAIDIGGGSVELIVGTGDEIYFTASEALGALRMSQRFGLQDRPSARSVNECRRFVAGRMAKVQKRVRRLGVDLCVGTSGTIEALAAMASGGGDSSGLKTLESAALFALVPALAAMTAAERAAKYGIDEKRAGSIVGGAIVLEQAMKLLEVDSLFASPAAMREGLIGSRVSELVREPRSSGSLRRRSVLSLAQRTDVDLRHGAHVARLATRIFDQTRKLHCLPEESRELLADAALLHECGLHISDRGHHKHSYYLIRHADLRGFTEEQLMIVANVARYYRKSPPDPAHENLAELPAAQQSDIQKLSAILRIAEGFDRGHRQRVRDVAVRLGVGAVRFIARTRADASVELEGARKRARYFADLFDVKVRFEAV
jgi:exopolyphosphatase/guanosine-5'-triphosphate,3'-diphosphate pyrophosphatase